MTKVIQVDCDKIKIVIALTLWALATFGLTYGSIYEINNIEHNGWYLTYSDGSKCCDVSFAFPVAVLFIITVINDFVIIRCYESPL